MNKLIPNLTLSRKTFIFIQLSFNWLLINVLFCLLPLGVTALLSSKITDTVLSSLISYSFTLTISSIYLFEKFSRPRNTLKWVGSFLAFIFLGLYVYYPQLANDSVRIYVIENVNSICIGLLLVTLLITYALNFRPILKDAEGESVVEKYKKASNSGKSADELKGELNAERQ